LDLLGYLLEPVTTKKYSLQAKESMALMLNMIGNHLPREAGNGWKLPTFHNTMHMVDDRCKYGKPKQANTEVGEKNHKFFAKCIGRHRRKQHKSFTCQVSVCLSDSFMIEKLASAMGLLTNKDEVHSTSSSNQQNNNDKEGSFFWSNPLFSSP
jgi:hypothetical protein